MSETLKAHPRRKREGFYERFCSGSVLDVGYAGTGGETMPGVAVTGVDMKTPGYDGKRLPFADGSFDTVYSSHMLEHVADDIAHLREQFRVVKKGGFLIVYIPHQWLYEKKDARPSRFNLEHLHFYTPAVILTRIEQALKPNTYRIRLLQDCDEGFNYSLPPEKHSVGEYAIEVVVQKL